MIMSDMTNAVMTQSGHPNDNWMGEGWRVVPRKFEAVALEYAGFLIVTRDSDGEIVNIEPDVSARGAWLDETIAQRENDAHAAIEELASAMIPDRDGKCRDLARIISELKNDVDALKRRG